MFQNNAFNSNRFQKRINRFKNPTFIEEFYNSFDFNNNLKSDNIAKFQFTNFTTSNRCQKYITLEEICLKINANNNEWSKLFLADEIDINIDIPKMNRIYNIISYVNNRKINREELILKFKNLKDQEIQFYIKNENGVLKLYLIDLYHLGIEAENKRTRRKDIKGIYNARKNCKFDIIEINKELAN